MRAAIQVELPEAQPQTYLAWVDWWRNIERVIRRLESMTSAGRGEGPKLLHGPVPGYLSRVFLEELRRQAHNAEQCGNEAVAPVLRADPRMLWDAASLLVDQARWLDGWLEDGVVSARLGLSSPGWRVELLRGRVVESVREQIRLRLQQAATSGPAPAIPMPRRGSPVLTLVEVGEPEGALADQLA